MGHRSLEEGRALGAAAGGGSVSNSAERRLPETMFAKLGNTLERMRTSR